MSLFDTAKERATSLAGSVVNKIAEQSSDDPATGQSVTVKCTVVEVEELFRDPHRLSVVLGEIGEVELTGSDRYRWTLRGGPVETTWESQLHSDIGGLRFVGTETGAGSAANEIIVSYRPAPHHLGTELSLRLKTPAPDLLTGALAFKVLYRCRALLQTGEVPTIRSNPSARPSAR